MCTQFLFCRYFSGIHSTFDGLYGQIRYYVEADIDKSVLSNVLPYRVYFDVISPPNFSAHEMRVRFSLRKVLVIKYSFNKQKNKL
jgi:hypothetical protein